MAYFVPIFHHLKVSMEKFLLERQQIYKGGFKRLFILGL